MRSSGLRLNGSLRFTLVAFVLSALAVIAHDPVTAQEPKLELPDEVTRYVNELKRVRSLRRHETIESLFTYGMKAATSDLPDKVRSEGPDYKFSVAKAMEGFEVESTDDGVAIYPKIPFFARLAENIGIIADRDFFAMARMVATTKGTYAFYRTQKDGARCVTLKSGVIEKLIAALNVYDLKYPDSYVSQREEWAGDLWEAVLEDNCVCETQADAVKALASILKAATGRRQEDQVRARLATAKSTDAKLKFSCSE